MESPVFKIQDRKQWMDIYGVAWTISVVFDKIERIVDNIQQNQNVANLTNVLQDMPQTELLARTFLTSLPSVILDVIDIITLKPVVLVSDSLQFAHYDLARL